MGEFKPQMPSGVKEKETSQIKREVKLTRDELPEEEKEKIEKYLVDNLEGEERIAEPMNPKCEAAVVMPVYGERDYILRALSGLAEQKEVRPEQFEVILVINNPPSIPDREENASASKKDINRDYQLKAQLFFHGVDENMETLDLIGYINGEDKKIDLSEEEKTIVENIRESGIRIHAIDKASHGKTFPKEIANVGAARNRGVAEAVARFWEQGRNGFLVHTDADTKIADEYIVKLIEIFSNKPELVGAAGAYRRVLEEETLEMMHAIALKKKAYAYDSIRQDLWDIFSDEELVRPRIEKKEEVRFQGANCVTRAFETALIGGVRKIIRNSDRMLGYDMAEIGKVERLTELKADQLQRRSVRVGMHGEGTGIEKYADMIEKGEKVTVKDPERDYLILRFYDLVGNKDWREIKEEDLREILTYKGNQILSDDEFSAAIKKINGANPPDPAIVHEIIDPIIKKIDASEKELELEDAIPKLIDIIGKVRPDIGELYRHYMEKEMAMEKRLFQDLKDGWKNFLEFIFQNKPAVVDLEILESLMRRNKKILKMNDFMISIALADENAVKKGIEAINNSSTPEEAYAKAPVEEYDIEKDISNLRSMQLAAISRALEEKVGIKKEIY